MASPTVPKAELQGEDAAIKFTDLTLARIALAFALVAAAFVPLFVRWCELELSPEATIFNRCWIATVILGLWQVGRRLKEHWWPSAQPELAKSVTPSTTPANAGLAGSETSEANVPYVTWGITLVSFVAMPVVWAWSLTQTSVANSALLHNLSPLFTTLAAWLLFKTRFDRRFLVGASCAIGGTIVLGFNDVQVDPQKLLGDALALLSALIFAIQLMGAERLQANAQVSSFKVVFWASVTGVVLLLPLILGLGDRLFPVSNQGWLAVIGLAVTGQLLAFGLIAYSLRQLSASVVALAFLLDPVLTAIAAWFAFGETLSLGNIAAFTIVLFGVYLGLTAKSAKASAELS